MNKLKLVEDIAEFFLKYWGVLLQRLGCGRYVIENGYGKEAY